MLDFFGRHLTIKIASAIMIVYDIVEYYAFMRKIRKNGDA